MSMTMMMLMMSFRLQYSKSRSIQMLGKERERRGCMHECLVHVSSLSLYTDEDPDVDGFWIMMRMMFHPSFIERKMFFWLLLMMMLCEWVSFNFLQLTEKSSWGEEQENHLSFHSSHVMWYQKDDREWWWWLWCKKLKGDEKIWRIVNDQEEVLIFMNEKRSNHVILIIVIFLSLLHMNLGKRIIFWQTNNTHEYIWEWVYHQKIYKYTWYTIINNWIKNYFRRIILTSRSTHSSLDARRSTWVESLGNVDLFIFSLSPSLSTLISYHLFFGYIFYISEATDVWVNEEMRS